MPKLRLKLDEIQDACVRKAITGSAGYFKLTVNDQAEIAGVRRATWYRRLKQPEEFSLKELRRMTVRYGWDIYTIGSFFGVKEELR